MPKKTEKELKEDLQALYEYNNKLSKEIESLKQEIKDIEQIREDFWEDLEELRKLESDRCISVKGLDNLNLLVRALLLSEYTVKISSDSYQTSKQDVTDIWFTVSYVNVDFENANFRLMEI